MASSGENPAPVVSVKALAEFFQKLETSSNSPPSHRSPPVTSVHCPRETENLEQRASETSDHEIRDHRQSSPKGLPTSCRPVPQPRISLLRKQSQCRHSPASRCHSHSSAEFFAGLKDNNNSIPEEEEEEEGDYASTCEEEEDIYEELPAEYHECDFRVIRDEESRKSSMTQSLGTLILKSKLLKKRIPFRCEEKGRKVFFPFARMREARDLPKPPCINVVNASIEQLNKETLSREQKHELVNRDEGTSDLYYDVRELGSDASASDDYYETISPLFSDSECVYEDVYGSSQSEQMYESLPTLTNYANCDRVEYVQIDARKTAELERRIQKEQKLLEKRTRERSEKLKAKFNLTGQEVPVNYGIVKEDAKKSKYKLHVKKGEVVLVLRMEENPPGLWLAKNERSEIGYVELANISPDANVVRSLMHDQPLTSLTHTQPHDHR